MKRIIFLFFLFSFILGSTNFIDNVRGDIVANVDFVYTLTDMPDNHQGMTFNGTHLFWGKEERQMETVPKKDRGGGEERLIENTNYRMHGFHLPL